MVSSGVYTIALFVVYTQLSWAKPCHHGCGCDSPCAPEVKPTPLAVLDLGYAPPPPCPIIPEPYVYKGPPLPVVVKEPYPYIPPVVPVLSWAKPCHHGCGCDSPCAPEVKPTPLAVLDLGYAPPPPCPIIPEPYVYKGPPLPVVV
ncbi:extensin-1-like [Diaphorina citri]|uniref:Extensin-1-like n=1 Tax=Diaphorina citri TaxID=121845 RepID=A0A1S3D4J7_DIACI|nr:extensin-1-like [Diaphorina citri]